MEPVLLWNLFLLVAAPPQTIPSPEHPNFTSDYNNGSSNSIAIGQLTPVAPIKLQASYDTPIVTPPPRLTTNEIVKPLSRQSTILTDQSYAPSKVITNNVKSDSILLQNANVEPNVYVHGQQGAINVPGNLTVIAINETSKLKQDLLASQSIRTDRTMEHILAKRTGNEPVEINATENSASIDTTKSEMIASDEVDRQFEEFKEATAKDPLIPCSLTDNQELLNSTIIHRHYSDQTGDGYEFKYFVPLESFRHEIGVLKNVTSGHPVLEVRGYYIWYLYKPESLFPLRYTYLTHYVANENGYQVEGEHIPGSQGKVPNKLPIQGVPCSDEDDRYGAPGLLLQDALLGGRK